MRLKTVRMEMAVEVPDERDGGRTTITLTEGAIVVLPFATANHLIKRGKARVYAELPPEPAPADPPPAAELPPEPAPVDPPPAEEPPKS